MQDGASNASMRTARINGQHLPLPIPTISCTLRTYAASCNDDTTGKEPVRRQLPARARVARYARFVRHAPHTTRVARRGGGVSRGKHGRREGRTLFIEGGRRCSKRPCLPRPVVQNLEPLPRPLFTSLSHAIAQRGVLGSGCRVIEARGPSTEHGYFRLLRACLELLYLFRCQKPATRTRESYERLRTRGAFLPGITRMVQSPHEPGSRRCARMKLGGLPGNVEKLGFPGAHRCCTCRVHRVSCRSPALLFSPHLGFRVCDLISGFGFVI